jgi:hypothetical protein
MDPYASLEIFDRKLDSIADPVRRANVEALREHVLAEMTADLEVALAGFAPEFSLSTRLAGAQTHETSRAELAGAYEAMFGDPSSTLWVEWERIVVDEQHFAGHGVMHSIMSGAAAQQQGVEVDDPGARYDVASPLAVFADLTDGVLTKEILFADPAGRVATKADDLPTAAAFRSRLGARATA